MALTVIAGNSNLARHKSEQAEGFVQEPVLVELLGYWERLRAGRVAPTRAELDPRQFGRALDHSFVLELTPVGDIRFRIAGTVLNTLLGMDLRTMPARSIIVPGHRDRFDRIVTDMLTDPKVMELRLHDGDGDGTARMLLLPMQNDAGAITRVLGCLVRRGPQVSPPLRLKLAGTVTTRIVAQEDRGPQVPGQTGFAEAASPFEKRDLRSERSYLRLVRDEE